ncbi:MAG: SPASM domain-containing protein [Candidatus Hydrogenedentes bacterium]|nr:SPASM domain-containing protein [Candidatus Hydrogenedentota bacterium]
MDHEGYLYPCVQFVREGRDSAWCIGNVFDGVDETVRQRIRAASNQEKEGCADCVVKGRCNNTCGCLNWQTTGTISAVSPVLCRYEQMLMKVADRVGKKLCRERNPLFLHKHYNAAYPVISLIEDAAKWDLDRTQNRPSSLASPHLAILASAGIQDQ